MNERTAEHATFVIDRTYDAPRERVFTAWADPVAKSAWFGAGDGSAHQLDFQVGGREVNRGGPPGGPVYTYEARIHDIVPDQRIAYAYDMAMDGTRISVSLATVEFKPSGEGTRLVYTEQDAFFDGADSVESREHGTKVLLDNLKTTLKDWPL